MGHVPAGPLPEDGAGNDLPRRQHRTAGTAAADVARVGEAVAARFLARRRATVLARNVRVPSGEIDLLVRIDGDLAAVEVKARIGTAVDPIENFTPAKAARVRRAARRLDPPVHRIDLVTVSFTEAGADVRWVPHVG